MVLMSLGKGRTVRPNMKHFLVNLFGADIPREIVNKLMETSHITLNAEHYASNVGTLITEQAESLL